MSLIANNEINKLRARLKFAGGVFIRICFPMIVPKKPVIIMAAKSGI